MEYQSGVVSPTRSIEEGWELIKNDYWVFFGMALISGVIIFAIAIILGSINNLITAGLSSVVNSSTQDSDSVTRVSASIVPQLIGQVIGFFVSIVVSTVTGVLYCGMYRALSRKADEGILEFGDLFSGFDKIVPCLIVALVLSLIQFVVGVVSILFGAAVGVSIGLEAIFKEGRIDPTAFGGLFLIILAFAGVSLIIQFIISALTLFIYPLIGERDLSGGNALMTSVKAGFSNIGGILLLLILQLLMLAGGFLLCGIGALFVAPILVASSFTAYRSVFGKLKSENNWLNVPPPPVFNNQTQF